MASCQDGIGLLVDFDQKMTYKVTLTLIVSTAVARTYCHLTICSCSALWRVSNL